MPELLATGVTLDQFNKLVRQGSQWEGRTTGQSARESPAGSLAGQGLAADQLLALAALSIFALLLSGVTFGWASLQLVLRDEGVYACGGGGDDYDGGDDDTCDRQDIRFALVYTVAQFAHVAASLPVGFLLDSPRIGIDGTAALGGLLVATGCALLSNPGGGDGAGSALVLPAMVLIGAGGPTVFFPMLRRAEGFPGWEAQVMTLLNALFDASAAVFALVTLVDLLLGL